MKNIYLFFLLMLIFSTIKAQELIVGGDMSNADAWKAFSRGDAPDESTFEFNYTASKPTAGNGGCLDAYGFGQTGLQVYQGVTIKPGHKYSFTGAFKNASPDPLTNTWVELILSRKIPDEVKKADYGAGVGDYIYAINSWMAAPKNNMDFDGTFQDNFPFTWKNGSATATDVDLTGSSEFFIPDTVTNTSWYVSFKAGCWNTAGAEVAPFDFLVDNISLIDLGVQSGNNLLSRKDKLFSVSPNPSYGIVTLNLKKSSEINYKIADFSGRVMLSGKCSGNSTLNLNHLKRGMYILSVTSGTKTESQKLILK
jgi:hypothetical protein